jgi:hypothetical protein
MGEVVTLTEEDRDLTAKEDTPAYDVDEDVIKDLAESMISDGFLMTQGRTSYWVSIITVKMFNPVTELGHSGVVFGGVYSTKERAMAATRGIAEDLARANKDQYPDMELENMVIETYIDTIPKDQFRPNLVDQHTETIDPEEL